jgi:hypothetical protein
MTELGLVLKARTVMLLAEWPFAFVVPSEAEGSAVCLGRPVVSALRRTADPSAPAEPSVGMTIQKGSRKLTDD